LSTDKTGLSTDNKPLELIKFTNDVFNISLLT
jgi:hypothetical protein